MLLRVKFQKANDKKQINFKCKELKFKTDQLLIDSFLDFGFYLNFAFCLLLFTSSSKSTQIPNN